MSSGSVASPAGEGIPSDGSAVEISGLNFGYRAGRTVLDIPALSIPRGERVFVFGPSGSGKTTLLGLLAGVLVPKAGTVTVLGRNLGAMSASQRDHFRAAHVGYIFQLFNLIPYLSVVDNIILPCRLDAGRLKRLGGTDLHQAAAAMAEQLGISALLGEKVTDLSVGQQQRVAAARALLGAPELVVADEPTSALDADLRQTFIQLLFRSCESAGATLVFVSHDRQLLPMFSSSLSLPDVNRASRAVA